MGLYDREYYRHDEPTGILAGRSMVVNLIIVNAAVFVAAMLTDQRVAAWLLLSTELISRPWEVWRIVTYGFVHDPVNIMHIVFNMLGLFFFGRELEDRYGRAEFLRFYLLAIVWAGLVWLLLVTPTAGEREQRLIGASGGVVAVIVLNVLHDPRRQVLLFGAIPMPAWAFALLFLLGDIFGTFNRESQVAHSAHLAGAAFGAAYFYFHWNFGTIVPSGWLKRLKGPRLRVHRPEDDDPRDLSNRVDEILAKIHRSGEASLTNEERRTLEEASRRYQRRHR